MATQLNLDPRLTQKIDNLVATGRFTSREDAVRQAVRFIWDAEYDSRSAEPLDPETIALLEQRIAEAGIPVQEVFAELRDRYRNWK